MDKIYIILAVLAGLILLCIIWCLIEPLVLDLDRISMKRASKDSSLKDLTVKKISEPTHDTSDSQPDLRVFLFSDLHIECCPITAKRLCNAIRKAHSSAPLDAVLFGGDIITYPSFAKAGYKYLSTVSSCCKELGIPFYGISGNHDWMLENIADSAGFTDLDNTSVVLTSHKNSSDITLAGLSDSGRRNRVWHSKLPSESTEPVVLLVHDPDAILHLEPEERPDYMLSGHLHGGQMKLPFKMEFTVLRRSDKLPRIGAVQGLYDINGTAVFISRGLGCNILPFRFLSLPEATVVEINL